MFPSIARRRAGLLASSVLAVLTAATALGVIAPRADALSVGFDSRCTPSHVTRASAYTGRHVYNAYFPTRGGGWRAASVGLSASLMTCHVGNWAHNVWSFSLLSDTRAFRGAQHLEGSVSILTSDNVWHCYAYRPASGAPAGCHGGVRLLADPAHAWPGAYHGSGLQGYVYTQGVTRVVAVRLQVIAVEGYGAGAVVAGPWRTYSARF
jgi:hypothetical protein